MDARLNRSEYKIIENRWRKSLEEGKKVTVKIAPIYKDNSLRPAEFKIIYKIDNKKYFYTLTNYIGDE